MFVITRSVDMFKVRTTLKRELATGIVVTWGFLVPPNTTWTGEELAGAIERYSCHPLARFDAQVVRHSHRRGN